MFRWSEETVLTLAAAAVEHSFLSEPRKRELIAAQRAIASGLREGR